MNRTEHASAAGFRPASVRLPKSLEALDELLERAERLNPILHAFLAMNTEDARQAARAAERQWLTPGEKPALLGPPVSIKDTFEMRGLPTTYGSKAFADHYQEDAEMVHRLRQFERRLAEVEADFAKNLDLLKREVLNEEEFNKVNVARRDERVRLTERQVELTAWVEQQHDRQETVSTLPVRVRSFLKDFQSLDVRRAKALLQTILATAHVSRDGTIELGFR